MEKLSGYTIIEETYRYEDEMGKDVHMKMMRRRGFSPSISLNPFLKNSNLIVTYQLRKLDDNIARL